MCPKVACILYIAILFTACSPGKGGNFFLNHHQADSIVHVYAEQKNYAGIDSVARLYMEKEIKNNRTLQAVEFGKETYHILVKDQPIQKKFVYDFYNMFPLIEKDTGALISFYNFFCYYFAYDYKLDEYDREYTDVGEHFIALQKKYPQLGEDSLSYFWENLGISYNVAGDLKKALNFYAKQLKYHITNNYADNIASVMYNISIALNESKRYDSVIRLTDVAMRQFKFSNSKLASLHTIRAEAHLISGMIAEAEKSVQYAQQLIPLLENSEGDSIKRVFQLEQVLSGISYARNDYAKSLQHARLAVNTGQMYSETYRDRQVGKSLLQMGSVFKKLNQPDSASWYFHQALYTVVQVDSSDINSLPEEKYIYAENTIMDALDSLATIWDEQYVRTKNNDYLKNALQARKLAFLAESKLLEVFSYDESMKGQLSISKKRSEQALTNCYMLWQNDSNGRWIEYAILMNEYSKAITLLRSLKTNTLLNDLSENDSTAILLRRNHIYEKVLEQELNTATNAEQKKIIQHQLDSLFDEAVVWETNLQLRLPGLKKTAVDAEQLTIPSLEKHLLNRQTCMLQYFRAGSGAFVVWLDGAQNQGIKWLPEKDLHMMDSFITSCRSPHGLYEKDKPAFFSLAKTCTDIALPDSIQQKIKSGQYEKLLIIPDGGFSMLPFDALTPAGDQFLVRFSTVYTGYSISTLLANDATNTKAKGMAVFAPFTKSAIGMLQRLEFSQDEAKAVDAANKQADLYTDTAARIERFRRSFETKAILHMATHATGNDSIQRIYFSDDSLDVKELYAAHTYAELVVLNGCETGVGRLDPNEGPLSLARGFYYAGARNVINSLWQIDDLATAGMFGNFYHDYSTGHTGVALRNAKLNYLNTNSGKLQAPYYWAGLVHTGIDNEKPVSKKSWWWIFPVALAIIASLILAPVIYKRRRH